MLYDTGQFTVDVRGLCSKLWLLIVSEVNEHGQKNDSCHSR